MYARDTATFVAILALLLGLASSPRAQTEEADSIREQSAQVAEEKAEVAKEEAEVAREAAALEEKKAALAEKKAAVARKEARVTKAAATRTQQLEQELAELKAQETERGLVLTLGDVLFESNEADLKADALQNLYSLVTFLNKHPNRSILIEGHTDSIGAEAYNLELSQRRAAAVRAFLVRNGVDPERITAQGYGQAYPVASNATEVGRQDNRRVEVVILREGEQVATQMR